MRIFDAHCDTLDLLGDNTSLKNIKAHYNFEKAAKYETHIQLTAIWLDNAEHDVPRRVRTLIKRFNTETQNVHVIKSAADLKNAEGVSVILGIEGGEGAEGSLQHLEELFGEGVRLMTLTWNHKNEISGTAFEKSGGLTDFGKKAVLKMQELHMMIDVSHLSDEGFCDVAEITSKPFIASHSNSRTVCPHFRNLTDDQFKVLIKRGGVAGINLCPDFLGTDPSVDSIVRHIEHFAALGGENNIGIGADFDGIGSLPRGIRGTEDLYKIFDRLLSLNYSQEQADKIAFSNMYRVFSEVLE